MIILGKYDDIFDLVKRENKFIVSLKKLPLKHKLRVIDFLSGLTFTNGTIKKVEVDVFEIIN